VAADGTVIAEGAHSRAGAPHAEAVALAEAGADAAGATQYVTHEPCAHHGRPPPCTDAIVDAGVARVMVGTADPDRDAAGGVGILTAAGVEVVTGLLDDECSAVDPGYFHHRRTGRPLVTLKLATTLDGQAAAADGTSQWITTEAARSDTHRLRALADAVMVGSGTLRDDDPRLDARPGGTPAVAGADHGRSDNSEGADGHPGDHQPRPVVVAGRRPLPAAAKLYDRNPLIYTPAGAAALPAGVASLPAGVANGPAGVANGPAGVADGPAGVESVAAVGDGGLVDLGAVLDDLGGRGVLDLLVEGGPTLAASFLASGLVDRIVWYLGPLLGGGPGRAALAGHFPTLSTAVPLRFVDVIRIGDDIRIIAELLPDDPDDVAPIDGTGGG
jgi:diaminohydroxyphosphoribosylaminopyrimidine deaminase/5-amino-6-(5-phosphoribosylamino)uracil reductase